MRKLFKGGNYSRAETIWGNTVFGDMRSSDSLSWVFSVAKSVNKSRVHWTLGEHDLPTYLLWLSHFTLTRLVYYAWFWIFEVLGLSFSNSNWFYFITFFFKGRKRNNDSASPSPPRPSKNELKNIRITIGDVSNNSKKSKKFTLLSPRTVEPNYKGYWSQVFFLI